jgi:hypothetical protein
LGKSLFLRKSPGISWQFRNLTRAQPGAFSFLLKESKWISGRLELKPNPSAPIQRDLLAGQQVRPSAGVPHYFPANPLLRYN